MLRYDQSTSTAEYTLFPALLISLAIYVANSEWCDGPRSHYKAHMWPAVSSCHCRKVVRVRLAVWWAISFSGWLEGERLRDNESGWFPVRSCEEIEDEHVRARNLRNLYRIIPQGGEMATWSVACRCARLTETAVVRDCFIPSRLCCRYASYLPMLRALSNACYG